MDNGELKKKVASYVLTRPAKITAAAATLTGVWFSLPAEVRSSIVGAIASAFIP